MFLSEHVSFQTYKYHCLSSSRKKVARITSFTCGRVRELIFLGGLLKEECSMLCNFNANRDVSVPQQEEECEG